MKTILIAILAVAMLAGCSGKKQSPAPANVPPENTEVKVEDAKKYIENAINLSNYTVDENDDRTESYSFRSDIFADYDLRYVVSLGSDTRINLPQSFPLMRSLGWETSTSLNLKPKASTNVVCEKEVKTLFLPPFYYFRTEFLYCDGVKLVTFLNTFEK